MANSRYRLDIRLRELVQLFNSMDPAPFVDRDLDPAAESYIINWAREQPAPGDFELVLHLENAPSPERAPGAEAAIRNYFAAGAQTKRSEFRQLLVRGRQTLLIGLSFLVVCLLLSGFVAHREWGTAGEIISESLTICGWVAMWRPLELYLYGWWPVRREERLLLRLAQMKVTIHLPPKPTA